MAFFGITTLGPPNIFELYRHHEISAVSKDDFFAAFRMVAGGEGTITPEQVKDVLYEAMGAPPHDGPVLDEYNTKHVTRPAKQYVSIQKLKDDRLKHRRCEGAAHEKMHAPITTQMELGWGH